jgi:hypothetical protein
VTAGLRCDALLGWPAGTDRIEQALNRAIAAGGGLGSAGVSPELTAVPGGDGRAELANVRTAPACCLGASCGNACPLTPASLSCFVCACAWRA